MLMPGGGILSRKKFLEEVYELVTVESKNCIVTTNKKIGYYNIPAAFDIEVSSFYHGERLPENKRAIMYIWQFGIGNLVTTGRTWEQFQQFIIILRKILCLNDTLRLVVYVHNLPYEFQFIRKRLEWDKIFILSKRKPVYAISDGIEFRCSLKLSGGKSLANIGEDLQKYRVQKAVGNLDYEIMRTPLTPLTETELLYCELDIRVLLCYIQEKIEQDGDITKIPLTNTGYVRRYCRKKCYRRWRKYRSLMNELTLEPDEYSQLKRAYQGGFTHANANYSRKIIYNVGSHDIVSSYPTVLVLEKFPMSKAKLVNKILTDDELLFLLKTKCCLFDIEFFDIVPIISQEHPISISKCWEYSKDAVIDNGRLVGASHITMTLTEQDYFTYSRAYRWEYIKIYNFRCYEKGYLPKPFVKAILDLYKDKTELKDVEGKEINYMISKNMINSAYGMTVTDPVRDEFEYICDSDDPFPKKDKDVETRISSYNSSKNRFLFYPWGVWVTAYARANLFSAIFEMGSDYVYSDTDSVKIVNPEHHTDYFERYNNMIMQKIEKSAKHFHFDISMYMPEKKIIGIWGDEGIYEKFKTIGAKRYLTFRHITMKPFEDNGMSVQLTVPVHMVTLAGANKEKSCAYLRTTKKPFENFDDDLIIPPKYAGRLVLTYIDNEIEGDIIDYNGVPYHYHELSCIHMESSEYNMRLSHRYIEYLKGLKDFGE